MRSLQVRREKRYQDGAERGERKGERFFENFGAIRARSIPVGISCPTIAESAQKRRPTSAPLPPY